MSLFGNESKNTIEIHLSDEQLDALAERVVDILIDRVGLFISNIERAVSERQAKPEL